MLVIVSEEDAVGHTKQQKLPVSDITVRGASRNPPRLDFLLQSKICLCTRLSIPHMKLDDRRTDIWTPAWSLCSPADLCLAHATSDPVTAVLLLDNNLT